MTKSTITRERLEELAAGQSGFNLRIATHEESKELARMAQAAMDGEPVAYTDGRNLGYIDRGRETAYLWGRQNSEAGDVPLYRHAQPAPETECEPIAWLNDAYLARGVVDGEAGSEDAGPGYIPVYREASPAQPAPVVPDEMLCEFYEVANWPDLVRELVKHVEQLQDSAKRNVKPWEDTFPETLLPAYIDRIKQADEACRAAMLQAGNSPVIPGGWQVEAEKLAEMYGMSFVLFRHGEAPQCADPTKVVISFTDKGLGHDTLPAAPQELK
ncbi:hypothetical protein [Klebsiella oxytoca]|uniref:hypothetical protein n=1 Tax=Klebsiella oxytoca TaxID=571 RepID=UPI001F23AF87|nr:hypothetical protein [Klebsiella oxytoca]